MSVSVLVAAPLGVPVRSRPDLSPLAVRAMRNMRMPQS